MPPQETHAIRCPGCNRTLRSRAGFAHGRRIICPLCSEAFVFDKNAAEEMELPKESGNEKPSVSTREFPPHVSWFMNPTGILVMIVGVLWFFLPIVLLSCGVVFIEGFKLPIFCVGSSYVPLAVPVF